MTAEFRVLASEPAYGNPFWTVRRDRVEFPGGSRGDYYVMERPAFAATVVRDDRGRLCLVSCYRHPIRARRWELPQGSGPAGRPLAEVAVDELREEAGVVPRNLRRIAVLHEAYGYSDAVCAVYEAEHAALVRAEPEPAEGTIDVGWFSDAQFWDLVRAGEVTDAVTIAAVALATRRTALDVEVTR